MANLGICPIAVAELWGAYYALLIAWNKGFRQVLLELDSSSAIALIHNECIDNHPFASIIKHVRHLLKRNWVVKIQHVFREANRTTDFMDSKGHEVHLGVCFYEVPPPSLSSFLRDDIVGVAFPRLIV